MGLRNDEEGDDAREGGEGGRENERRRVAVGLADEPPRTMPAGKPNVIPARTMPMLVPRELASLTSAVIVYAVANTSALPIPHVTRARTNQLRNRRADRDHVAERREAFDRQPDDERFPGADPVDENTRRPVGYQSCPAIRREDDADHERRNPQYLPEVRQDREDDAAAEADEEGTRDDGVDDGT